jgi:hypothetical protein
VNHWGCLKAVGDKEDDDAQGYRVADALHDEENGHLPGSSTQTSSHSLDTDVRPSLASCSYSGMHT